MRYVLEPHVAGELGEATELDTSTHPPIVAQLEYVFDSRDPDDLVESFPCFLVSRGLAQALTDESLTGYTLADATCSLSPNLARPWRRRPAYRWLQVTGTAGDDFSIAWDYRLVVSTRAMTVLRRFRLDDCEVSPA